MKRLRSAIFAATILAVSAVVFAQSPSTSPSTPGTNPSAAQNPTPAPPAPATPAPATPSATAQSASSGDKMTLTGCLREAGTGTAATSGSAAATPGATDAAGTKPAGAESKYVLEDATPASSSGSTASAQTATPRTYHLIANDSALAPHVGKKLELTGTLESQTASAQAGASSATASASAAPTLRVESGNVMASSCTK